MHQFLKKLEGYLVMLSWFWCNSRRCFSSFQLKWRLNKISHLVNFQSFAKTFSITIPRNLTVYTANGILTSNSKRVQNIRLIHYWRSLWRTKLRHTITSSLSLMTITSLCKMSPCNWTFAFSVGKVRCSTFALHLSSTTTLHSLFLGC